MTGYSAEEVHGRDPRFLQGPATDRRVLDRLRTDLEAGRPFQGETINYRKDGTPFTMAWRIAAVRSPAGVIGIYGAPILSIVIALALALQGARMRSLGARLMRWADAALMPRLRLPRLRLPKLRRA